MRLHQAITRRRALGLAGAAGATYVFARFVPAEDAAAAPSCVLTPAKTFTVGLSGLAADDDTVGFTLKHRGFHRSDAGRRVLRLTVDADEQVALRARLSRSGHRLARRRFPSVTAGTHKLNVSVPSHVRGGVARLTLYVRDQAGNTKVIRRTVRVPRRS
jgi:hypothetical protein